MKHDPEVSFEKILTEMYHRTGNVEASFSSKMLATIQPDMPIWDHYVIQYMKIKVPSFSSSDRMKKIVQAYDEIVQWYAQYLETDNAKECVRRFDEVLPDYQGISDVKKIDFFLWSIR